MIFDREPYFSFISDADALLKMHYAELTLHKELVQLAPMHERYARLESDGKLEVYTARLEGELVGYSLFVVDRHIHYRDLLVASNDVLYLRPECRRGVAGIRLIRYSEEMLAKRGVDKVFWHIKFNREPGDKKDFRAIMHRMGYSDEEVVVGKILKRT
jgi:GNAT superfamily N-acetyltransferase